MITQNYRIDSQTGAIIFKKSAGRQKAQQMKQEINELTKRVDLLEKQNKLLIKTLTDIGILQNDFVDI